MNGPTFLYRHFDGDGQLLYVGIASDHFGRTWQHRHSHWMGHIRSITFTLFDTRDAASAAEIEAIKTECPIHNVCHAVDEDVLNQHAHIKAFLAARCTIDRSNYIYGYQLFDHFRKWSGEQGRDVKQGARREREFIGIVRAALPFSLDSRCTGSRPVILGVSLRDPTAQNLRVVHSSHEQASNAG